jgi:type VI secretion system secreted protein Hcp
MAHVDYFLKIDGVDGESTDDKHKKEIELESWSFGGSNPGSFASGGGGGTGKVATATLVCRKAGKEQQEFLTIVLTGVLVSSFQSGGSAGSDIIPMDQVSLNYGKIEYKYKEQKPDGSLGGEVIGGWDVTTNKHV